MKNRQLFKLGAGAGLATMLVGALLVLAPGAGAEHLGTVLPAGTVQLPAGGGPVPICHATSAETNPYIRNTPNVSATGEFFGSNHASHTGPVFAPGMKSARPKVQWGDIIPPVAVDGHLVFAGSQNWLSGGAEQYATCSAVVEEPADPVIVVEKDVPGEADDPTPFSFTVAEIQGQQSQQVGSGTISDGGSFETVVTAGQISIQEATGDDHTLTGVACTRDRVVDGQPVEDEVVVVTRRGDAAELAAAAGDIITCTFTNTPDPQQTSSITVDKTNNANGTAPFSEAEQATGPGVAVPFQVVITNTGTTALTLETLTDTWTGLAAPIDLLTVAGFTCTRGGGPTTVAAGTELPAGSVTTCTFSLPGYAPAAGGSKTNTVGVTTTEDVVDDDTSTVTTPNEQIIVTPTPPTPPALTYTFDVDKRNDASGDGVFADGESADAEGDDVTFQVTIRNTGTGALTLTSLTDSFDGDVVDLLAGDAGLTCDGGAVTLGVGSVLAAGTTTTCTFVLEDYAPAAGEDRVNTITVDTDQTGRRRDDSTVSTPEVLGEEEEPPVVVPPPVVPPGPPAVVPVAQPQSQVQGAVTARTLPRTGDDSRALAGVGALMLAMGAAMMLASRRQLARR